MAKKRSSSTPTLSMSKWWWCGLPIVIAIYLYHYESSLLLSMHQLHEEEDTSNTNVSSSMDYSTRIEIFTNWFKDNGGVSNNISIHYFERYGHGIKSSSSIVPMDKLLHVPKHLIM